MQQLLRGPTVVSSAHLSPTIAPPTFSKLALCTEIHTAFYHTRKHPDESTMFV